MFVRGGKVICKKDGHYIIINTPDDLFMISCDDGDYRSFGIDLWDIHGAQTEAAPSEWRTDLPGPRIFTLNVCGIRSKTETPDFMEMF